MMKLLRKTGALLTAGFMTMSVAASFWTVSAASEGQDAKSVELYEKYLSPEGENYEYITLGSVEFADMISPACLDHTVEDEYETDKLNLTFRCVYSQERIESEIIPELTEKLGEKADGFEFVRSLNENVTVGSSGITREAVVTRYMYNVILNIDGNDKQAVLDIASDLLDTGYFYNIKLHLTDIDYNENFTPASYTKSKDPMTGEYLVQTDYLDIFFADGCTKEDIENVYLPEIEALVGEERTAGAKFLYSNENDFLVEKNRYRLELNKESLTVKELSELASEIISLDYVVQAEPMSLPCADALPRYGDINSDHNVDLSDVILAQKSVIGSAQLNTYQRMVGDIDCDDEVTSIDSGYIMQSIIGNTDLAKIAVEASR